jgi:hypothetical protein
MKSRSVPTWKRPGVCRTRGSGEANRRMRAMRTDPAQAGLHVPFLAPKRSSGHKRSHVCASSPTFPHTTSMSLPKRHDAAPIADHIDSTMSQTLASRAYQAVNRLARGQGETGARKRVRGEASGVWRANATLWGCVSCSIPMPVMAASWCGIRRSSPSSSIGSIPSCSMAWAIRSSMCD